MLIGLLSLFTALSSPAQDGPGWLIPQPVSYTVEKGSAATFREPVVQMGSRSFRKKVATLPDFAREEAYELSIGRKGIRIEALTEKGAFRARTTLEQMLLQGTPLPCCTVFDYPRFRHRGLMIDESRSFKGKEFILKQIDAMALLKMNVLHLHLDDSAGWRIEVDGYPNLTRTGAWRIGDGYFDWEKGGYQYATADTPDAYGGYYTKQDLRDIVAYAAERHITVIPEIEMPGHSLEVNRAYPELACRSEDGTPRAWSWDLCPGKEETFHLLESVLEEVMETFPSPYIHIGGDEAVMKDWAHCVDCQRRMREEGMTEVHELQGYLVRRIDAFIRSRGRHVIGWDEIVETGLPADATVQSWRGTVGGKAAIAQGHDVVMSPNTHLYLDYYQDLIRKEPRAFGHLQSLRHVYSYDPDAGIPEDGRPHVLGVQGNLWCECIPTREHAEYMLYPRAFAIAEIAWSPQEIRSYPDFHRRVMSFLPLFHALGYNSFDLAGESERAQSFCFERSSGKGYNYVLQEDGGPVLSYGWDSGVRIIVADGHGFRDMNGNGILDPFEDWRLDPAVRAGDLRMRTEPLYEIDGTGDLEAMFRSGDAENPYHAVNDL